ncbi:MBOAT family O-acyltransferase [Oxalobacteraceae bacterium A2-2]
MLFNSFGFLFLYLPVVLAVYFGLARRHPPWGTAWLAAASLYFYGAWDWRYLPLLCASIVLNYACGLRIAAAHGAPVGRRWLRIGLAGNLLLLAYYKYANFFLDSVNRLAGSHWQGWSIVLPVGISFFTFTQVAFLVDCRRGSAHEFNFLRYALFVSYFPHLVAGPVLHHKEMMPQFAAPENSRPRADNFAIGSAIFVLGLAKKVLVADQLAPLAAPVFAPGAGPQLIEAWVGMLAYSFQLYYDFSGYSDMATGLSRLFGVRLPQNFNSPYQAANISDFWRRWHMTLSRFLRDYLYVPLGGSRYGGWLRYRNLMLTMLLGGLWHGAAWTFVLWGGLHGLYLAIHHGWQALAGGSRPRWWGRALTFLAVALAWVPFRAPDLATAGSVLAGLAGLNGINLPHGLATHARHLDWLHADFSGIRWIDAGGAGLPVLLLAMLAAFLLPNVQTWFASHRPCLDSTALAPPWGWAPGRACGLAFSLLLLACLFGMNKASEFLYSQF